MDVSHQATWALKDRGGNWGRNDFTLMHQITSHFDSGMCQSHHPRVVAADRLNIISPNMLITVRANEEPALLILYDWDTTRHFYRVHTWLLRWDLNSSFYKLSIYKNEVMRFPTASYCSALFSCSPTCLCLLEQREPLPATYTIKWRVMKLYRWPGQIAGWRS